jgi:hypothetical protein
MLWYSILDTSNTDYYLSLMCDTLQELSELSLELQTRGMNLYDIHQPVKRQKRTDRPSLHYTMVLHKY